MKSKESSKNNSFNLVMTSYCHPQGQKVVFGTKKDFKNLKVTDELNAAQKSATGLGDEVKLCSLIIDAKDTSIKVYREYPEYSFSTLVSDIGGSGIWFNIINHKLLHMPIVRHVTRLRQTSCNETIYVCRILTLYRD